MAMDAAGRVSPVVASRMVPSIWRDLVCVGWMGLSCVGVGALWASGLMGFVESWRVGVVGLMRDICALAEVRGRTERIKLTLHAKIIDLEIWRILIKTVVKSNGLMFILM